MRYIELGFNEKRVRMTNNSFMLIALIYEKQLISGYDLNKIIETRGYRSWADIGTTSIYVNLKKLSIDGYIIGTESNGKRISGPSSILYSCTDKGILELKQHVKESIHHAREHDRRFDLALSVCNILSKNEIKDSLKKRIDMLEKEISRINKIRMIQSNEVSFQGVLLFERTILFIEREIDYTKDLIVKIEREMF